jgi:hypothetical protein
MNARIKSLIDQATVWQGMENGYIFDKEKFAELIVRDCLDQCYHRGMNDELYAGQLKAAWYIEQHFGVEE